MFNVRRLDLAGAAASGGESIATAVKPTQASLDDAIRRRHFNPFGVDLETLRYENEKGVGLLYIKLNKRIYN